MKDSLSFQFSRFGSLLRNELRLNHRNILIVAGGVLAVLLFISVLTGYNGGSGGAEFYYVWYGITLLGGGFLYTSVAFRELNRPTTGHVYLMTPASTLEKFLTKWLLTTFGYVLAHLVVFSLYVLIMNGLHSTWSTEQFSEFSLSSAQGPVPILIQVYLCVQSLYLVGAVWFNKFEFFKTPLALNIVSLAFTFVIVLMFRIVFWDLFDGWNFSPKMHGVLVEPGENAKNALEFFFKNIALNLVRIGGPLFLWTVAFFKLKEKEV